MKKPVMLIIKLKSIAARIKLELFGDNIFYVNGPQTLPPPLEKNEEDSLLQRLSDGDESVRRELIVRNLRLVVYIAKKFESSGVDVEDLVSIGTIGLIKAVNTFSPEKNIKLATYASRCIENEILMYLRKTSSKKCEVSFDEPLNVDCDGNELLLSDILINEDENISRDIELEDEKKLLLSVVDRLGDREKLIINMRFALDGGEEYTQKQVADSLGISQSYISRLEKRILSSIRKEMNRFNC